MGWCCRCMAMVVVGDIDEWMVAVVVVVADKAGDG